MDIGQRIKRRRKFLDLSQRELAERANVSLGSIQYWEAGNTPSGNNLLKLVEALECNLNWLLSGSGPMEPKIKEPSPLWGKTQQHEVEGRRVDVTVYEPDRPEPEDPLEFDIHDLTIEEFYILLREYIDEMAGDPSMAGWLKVEFMDKFPKFVGWLKKNQDRIIEARKRAGAESA